MNNPFCKRDSLREVATLLQITGLGFKLRRERLGLSALLHYQGRRTMSFSSLCPSLKAQGRLFGRSHRAALVLALDFSQGVRAIVCMRWAGK